MSKVLDCHFINDFNGETKQVSAPQSEQVSKVQAFHIMNESNGETMQYILLEDDPNLVYLGFAKFTDEQCLNDTVWL